MSVSPINLSSPRNIIRLEKTENFWVVMLPEAKCLSNTAQNEAQTKQKGVSRTQCGSISQLRQWYWSARNVAKAAALS